ncbi:hypothetical protein CQ062_08550 [Ochrobactrum sp. MYb68]|nr:hypothetical protein CQ062_08550 [Ochrobactrum sp. MYb68]
MEPLKASQIYTALRDIHALVAPEINLGSKAESQVSAVHSEDIKKALRRFNSHSVNLPIKITRSTVSDLHSALKNKKKTITYKKLQEELNKILDMLEKESRSVKLFIVSDENTGYLGSPNLLFGERFVDNFPSAMYDLDEARTCLAFGRSTAAIFHLMRAMEIVLYSVHRCLGIDVTRDVASKSWGNILSDINNAISAKGNKWKEKDFFKAVSVQLDAVKDAWRNQTMHGQTKYTEAEAKEIFLVVKGFFRKVADRMDESGLPSTEGVSNPV